MNVIECPNYSNFEQCYINDKHVNPDNEYLARRRDALLSVRRDLLNRVYTMPDYILDIVNKIRYPFFLDPYKPNPECYQEMLCLDAIREQLDSGVNYSELDKKLLKAYKNIVSKRMSNSINSGVAAYADFIDVNIQDYDIVDPKVRAWKAVLNEKSYDRLKKLYNMLENFDISKPKADQLEDWLELRAFHSVYRALYTDPNSCNARAEVVSKYSGIFNKFDGEASISIEVENLCNRIKNKAPISGNLEDNLFKHDCKLSNYSELERRMFRMAKVYANEHTQSELFKQTSTGVKISNALQSGNKSYAKILLSDLSRYNTPFMQSIVKTFSDKLD